MTTPSSGSTLRLSLWLVFAGTLAAQCPLATTFAGGNNQSGNMFDVVATNAITVTGFDQNLFAGTTGMAIYTKPGGYAGFQANPAAWTLLGTTTGLVSLGVGLPTPVPIAMSVPIAAGATQAFYVTSTTTTVPYTNGTAVGATAGQDANLKILQGIGVAYNFGGTYTPRVWNGRIQYSVAFPDWQANQPGATLTLDGLQGSPCTNAVLTKTVCTPTGLTTSVVASLSSTAPPGGPWDLIFTASPAVPVLAGGLLTPGGQRVNLNLFDPSLFALFNLSGGPPFSNATLSATFTTNFATTMQMLVLDAASPDGFWLSQPCELHVVDTGGIIPGPTGDDTWTTHSFGLLPCGPPNFPFYGTPFTTFSVTSNGRVMFGTPTATPTPSISSAMSQPASINAWVNLDPSPVTGGGSVSISVPTAGIVRAQWTNVPYAGLPGTSNTFAIVMDTYTGAITIENVATFLTAAGNPSMFLGLSAGPPVAQNPGATTFALGGPNPGPAGLGMIYSFGPAGTLTPPGLTSLIFVPNGANNYTWTGI